MKHAEIADNLMGQYALGGKFNKVYKATGMTEIAVVGDPEDVPLKEFFVDEVRGARSSADG